MATVIGGLENSNALISPFFGFSINDVTVALTQLADIPVYIPADAEHFGIFNRQPFPKK